MGWRSAVLGLGGLVWGAVAAAEEPAAAAVPQEPVEAAVPQEPAAAPVSAAAAGGFEGLAPEALLDEAVLRIRLGDFAGADARLAALMARAPSAAVRYHRARSAEFQGRPEAALDDYAAVEGDPAAGALAADAGFRRALCLGDLGRHGEAVAVLDGVAAGAGLSAADRVTLDITRATSALLAAEGRKAEKAAAALEARLGAADAADAGAWVRGRAWIGLAEAALRAAAGVEMTNGRKARKRLEARAGWMGAAEQHILAAVRTGEPEHALRGLLLLGDGYVALHEALHGAPPPKRLDAAGEEVFRAALTGQTAVLLQKAWRFYDEGVQLALRVQWQGPPAAALRERRDGLGLGG